MTDILHLLKEEFDGAYDYLRLGRVEVSTQDRRANVVFLMPEDIFDYHFNSADVEKIKDVVKKALGGSFTVYCKFEKIVVTEENFKSALIEYMEKHFPLVSANIDFTAIQVKIDDKIRLEIPVAENLKKYMETVDFDERIKKFIYERFSSDSELTFVLIPDDQEIKIETKSAQRYGKSVSVTDKKILFGKESELLSPAVHISTLKGEGQDVVCCGKVAFLRYYDRDESKRVEGRRFYPHYYTFSINDTTGSLNVFVNIDGAMPLLQNGVDVVCRGRVNSRDDKASLSMYARSIALCTVPYALIHEQTKPLAPPERYSVLEPKPYEEEVYSQIRFDMGEVRAEEPRASVPPTVTAAIRVIKTERAFVPYEIAMCFVEGNKIREYVHSFLKVAFTEKTERAEFANAKGYASPRLSTVIPDLIKFSAGKPIAASNPQFLLDLLNQTAKPLRYLFSNESRTVSISQNKGEGKVDGALEEAVEIAKELLRE